MSRGRMLSELISDLRDELRRANHSSASPDDIPSLRRTLNRVMTTLWLAHDWPHLKHVFPAVALAAGQRYYDLPAGLGYERISDARVKIDGMHYPLTRGIDPYDYDLLDPEADERGSPVTKWDIKFTGAREQIEVWPVPDDTTQALQVQGYYTCPNMVNDSDLCPLDSEIVVLLAAVELLPKDAPDRDTKASQAQERLRMLRARGGSGSERDYTNGAGMGSQTGISGGVTMVVR